MQVTISFKKMDSSDALKNYVYKKLERIARFSHKIIDIDVVLSLEHQKKIAQFVVKSKGDTFKCTEEADDMYAAIDLAIDVVERYFADGKRTIRKR